MREKEIKKRLPSKTKQKYLVIYEAEAGSNKVEIEAYSKKQAKFLFKKYHGHKILNLLIEGKE